MTMKFLSYQFAKNAKKTIATNSIQTQTNFPIIWSLTVLKLLNSPGAS